MMNQEPIYTNKIFTWKDGKSWFDSGVNLFKKIKNLWYMLCFFLAIILMVSSEVSTTFVGFIMVFVSPIVTAFVMKACQLTAYNEPFKFSVVWSAVLNQLNGLLLLGVYAVLLSVFFQQAHIQLLTLFQLPLEVTEAMMKTMTGKELFVRALLNLATNLPVALAMAFAPPLIMFFETPPHIGIKHSVLGVIRAWKAFITLALLFMLMFFGLVVLATLVVSIITVVMGPASQVLTNVILLFFVVTIAGVGLCAQYQAFIEIFDIKENPVEDHGTEIYTEI